MKLVYGIQYDPLDRDETTKKLYRLCFLNKPKMFIKTLHLL